MGSTYPAKALKGDLGPGFTIELAHKDLGLAIELARSLGVPVATDEPARASYSRVRQSERGRQGWTAIYAMAREAVRR